MTLGAAAGTGQASPGSLPGHTARQSPLRMAGLVVTPGGASAQTPSWRGPTSDARSLDRAPGRRPKPVAWRPGTGSSASE